MRSKRASIREAVFWIAANDDPVEMDPETVGGQISVLLVADIFGLTPENVAQRVTRERWRMKREEERDG